MREGLSLADHMVLDGDAIPLELEDDTCIFTGKPLKVVKINPELERGKYLGRKCIFYCYPPGTHEIYDLPK